MSEMEITKKNLFLARPFRYLDAHELNMLIAYCKVVSFIPGQFLLQQGHPGDGMFVIIKGKAMVIGQVLGMGLVNFATVGEGNFIGEVNLLEKGLCIASVEASSPLEALLITHSYFDMLSTFFPEVRYKISRAITEVVCERLKIAHVKVLEIMQENCLEKKGSIGEFFRYFTQAKSKEITFEEFGLKLEKVLQFSFFQAFTEEEIMQLLKYSKLILAPNKCTLIQEGEKTSAFYLILEGAVQSCITKNNVLAKLSVLGPLDLFGSTSFVDDLPASMAYVACESVILLKIDLNELKRLNMENTPLWYKMYDQVSGSYIALERAANKLFIRLNSEFYNESSN